MLPSKEFLLSHAEVNSAICRLVINYCRATKLRHPCEDEIGIDCVGDIRYSWRENNSCHCHPEYETKTQVIKFEDFYNWVNETGQEI